MLSRLRPVLCTKGGPIALVASTLAFMPQALHAQPIDCHFTQPVRIISSTSELPPVVQDGLTKDGLFPTVDAVTSTAGPRFIYAGQFKDIYFVWSSRGDRLVTEFISLYRADQPTRRVRIPGPFAGPDWTRWCKRTADLLGTQIEPVGH